MNPLNDPVIVYLRCLVADRVHRLRTEERNLGVSAIEWAIITGMVAAIAIAIYAVISSKIEGAAENIKTK